MTHPNPPRPAFPRDAPPRTDTAPGAPTGGVNSGNSNGSGFGPATHAPHSLAARGAGTSEAAPTALPGPGPAPAPAGPPRLSTTCGAAPPPEVTAAPAFGPVPAGRGAPAPHRTARRRPEPGAGERGLRSVRPQRRSAGPRRWTRTPGAGALVVADGAAGLIGLCEVGPDGGPVLPAVLLGVLLAVHRRAGLYRPKLAPAALDEVPEVALGAFLAWGLAAAALAATAPHDALGWTELAYAFALTAASSVAARALAYRLRLHRARREPAAALVVGAGQAAQQVAAVLRAHPEYGLRPVGVASAGAPASHQGLVARQAPRERDRDRDVEREPATTLPLPVLAGRADITRAVIRNSVRYAVVVGPSADPVVGLLARRGCQVWQVGSATRPPHLWGYAIQPVRRGPDVRRHVKRAMDVVLSAAALTAIAPVLGGCALAVRLADGPGVLFRQERIGLDGRPFTLLKFRTLRPHDSDESATRWNIANDRRMSGVGRLMRRTSLDELPQLWNVLRGDMSLVGPRPERPHFVAEFAAAHPGYEDRHRMPAGITGLAQVHGLRGDTSIADRARFDNHYIDTWSLWQDVAIMLRTAATLFRLGGS